MNPTSKRCSKCKDVKSATEFFKNSRKTLGLTSQCKTCHKDYWSSEHGREIRRRLDKSEKKRLSRKRFNQSEKRKEYQRRYKQSEKYKRQQLQYRQSPKGLAVKKHLETLRRSRKMQACPLWIYLQELKEIYSNCPKGFHVDHIIPLTHPDVSGLHVPWNLQYLPAPENMSKHNKLPDKSQWIAYVEKD